MKPIVLDLPAAPEPVLSVIPSIKVAPAVDCRLCQHYSTRGCLQFSGCKDGASFTASQPVRFWEHA